MALWRHFCNARTTFEKNLHFWSYWLQIRVLSRVQDGKWWYAVVASLRRQKWRHSVIFTPFCQKLRQFSNFGIFDPSDFKCEFWVEFRMGSDDMLLSRAFSVKNDVTAPFFTPFCQKLRQFSNFGIFDHTDFKCEFWVEIRLGWDNLLLPQVFCVKNCAAAPFLALFCRKWRQFSNFDNFDQIYFKLEF